ncbi:MAG: arginase [Kyrpidia tusciae]|nr:arginase [Kyrpidia tusciae]MBE3552728.1 arginase [Kyrpidia tusciae]
MTVARIEVLGVPLDLGQGRRGVDMGPSAIRYAGLQDRVRALGFEVQDLGNVPVPEPEAKEIQDPKLKYLPEIERVSEEIAARVSEVLKRGSMPVILGGDHSLAIGSLAGVALAKARVGVIWFDAHGDMNTQETTPSGNIHGMPLAVSLGLGHPGLTRVAGFAPKVRPENVVLVGARSIDEGEARLIRKSGLRVFTMHEIDRQGIGAVMEEAIRIASRGVDGVHLSLDLDALDPMTAPGVGTPVRGGITYREGHLAMELLAEAGVLCSVDVVEVNPILDVANRTAEMAVDLLCSALGKKILPDS